LQLGSDNALRSFQVASNFGELGESGLEIFDDFLSDNIRIGKSGAAFKRLIF